MASISEPFAIAELSKITLKKSEQIPLDARTDDGTIHVGLSFGSVSSYRLRPTPSIRSLHSVSPGTKFTALCSANVDKDRFVLAYAYYERKKSFIKVVSPNLDPQERSQEPGYTINVTDFEGGEVCGLKFSSERSHLYAVFKNSSVVCYQLPNTEIKATTENTMDIDESPEKPQESEPEAPSLIWTIKAKSSRVPVLTEFSKVGGLDVLVVVEKRIIGKRHGFDVRVVSLEPTYSKELINLELAVQDEQEEDDSVFTYGTDGYLYRLSKNSLVCHHLVSGNLVKSFDMSSILISSGSSSEKTVPSIAAVGQRRVVVSNSDNVYLIDTNFGSILASQKVHGNLTILGFAGQPNSLIVGILTSKSSDPLLVGVSVSAGQGTLLESLGRGLEAHKHTEWELGFTNVLNMKNLSLKDYTTGLTKKITSSQYHATKVLEDLAKYKDSKDIKNFERLVLYLQGTNWEEITDKDVEVLLSSDENIPVFDLDRDREVDKDFIFRAVGLLMEELVPKNEDRISTTAAATTTTTTTTYEVSIDPHFVPEFAFIYLLTHPLFPTVHLSNLLEALAPFPRLFRQAVVTTPDLSCRALVEYLEFPDDEIFCDIVARISQEFSTEQITKAIDKVYFAGASSSTEESSADLIESVRRLIRLDVGWSIIPALIDAGGLFLWSSEVIEELIASVKEQVGALEVTAQTLTVIDEVTRRFNISTDSDDLKKLSKREIKKISKKNATDDVLLKFPQGKSFTEEHVPAYVIEELEIS